jgi:hypothetical protein
VIVPAFICAWSCIPLPRDTPSLLLASEDLSRSLSWCYIDCSYLSRDAMDQTAWKYVLCFASDSSNKWHHMYPNNVLTDERVKASFINKTSTKCFRYHRIIKKIVIGRRVSMIVRIVSHLTVSIWESLCLKQCYMFSLLPLKSS